MIRFVADDISYVGPENFKESILNAFLEFSARANLIFNPSSHQCIYQGSHKAPVIYDTPIMKRS